MDKSGLLILDANALYGALLSQRAGAGDKRQVEQWAALGGRAFARESRLRNQGKEPIVITFPHALDREVTTALRAVQNGIVRCPSAVCGPKGQGAWA